MDNWQERPASIRAGEWDQYLQQFEDSLREWRQPLVIRAFWDLSDIAETARRRAEQLAVRFHDAESVQPGGKTWAVLAEEWRAAILRLRRAGS